MAPYGKEVREIASIVESFDDSGTCPDESCAETGTTIESTLEIDTSQGDEKVFPLLITFTGQYKGQELTQKTWKIPFDFKQWSYVAPTDWPLKDADF